MIMLLYQHLNVTIDKFWFGLKKTILRVYEVFSTQHVLDYFETEYLADLTLPHGTKL